MSPQAALDPKFASILARWNRARAKRDARAIRRGGPCFLCDAQMDYGYCGYHENWGDSWLDRLFEPIARAEGQEMIRDGKWYSRNHTAIFSAFTCKECQRQAYLREWTRAREKRAAQA